MFGQEITTARCSTGSKAEVLCPTLKAAEWSMAFAGKRKESTIFTKGKDFALGNMVLVYCPDTYNFQCGSLYEFLE